MNKCSSFRMRDALTLFSSLFEVIDVRSFSSLWYWIALAAYWTMISQYVIGVPFDLVLRAAKDEAKHMPDLEDLVRINVLRILEKSSTFGPVQFSLLSAVLTALFMLGIIYGIEIAQASFLLICPILIVIALNARCARSIYSNEPSGTNLISALKKHRFTIQIVGVISVFITSVWGMYQNILIGPLG